MATDRRGDRHVRAARDDSRTRAGSRPPRTPTLPVPTVTTTRACSTRGRPARSGPCSATGRPRMPPWPTTTSRRPGTSRGPVDPEPHRAPWRLGPAGGHRDRPRGVVPGALPSASTGARRQGVDRVERPDDLVAGRGRRAPPAERLDRRRGPCGTVPHRRAARCERPVEAGLARRRRPEGQPRGAGRRPRRARRRLHRGWPRPQARRPGSPRRWRPPTRCSTTSGTPARAGCSPPPTTANSSSHARRISSTTRHRRRTRRPPSRCTALPRSRARPGLPTTPTGSSSSSDRSSSRAASGFGNALAALVLRSRGIKEVAVVGDRRDLLAVVHERWRPNVVLAWGEPYDSPLWTSRGDGLAYVCEHFVCQAPQDTPDGLRAQLDAP